MISKKMFSLVKLTCSHTWEEEGGTSEYTFGSVKGAQHWVAVNINELRWYSIEAYDVLPCWVGDTEGQLFYGMTYSEHWELDTEPVIYTADGDSFVKVTL